MRESKIEARLVERVAARGGVAEKFTSPGRRSVPDRIVSWPKGRVQYVECKATGEEPTAAQKRDHKRRRRMGFSVYVVDCMDDVEDFIALEGPQ